MIHNLEAEQGVLGSILFKPDSLLEVVDTINTKDFYHASHRAIFNAIYDQYELGEGINLMSITQRLRNKGDLEKSGGATYVSKLFADVNSPANVKYYAKMVKDSSILRSIHDWAGNLMQSSKNGGVEDVRIWCSQVQAELVEISKGAKPKKDPKVQAIMREVNEYWSKVQAGERTNIATVDWMYDIAPGYYPTHEWIITGYTGFGKSTLLNQLICEACINDAGIVLFSTEETRRQKVMRMISYLKRIPYRKLVTGDVLDHANEIKGAQQVINEWNIFVYDDVRTIDELRMMTMKHKLQNKIDIVCLDYIQGLRGDGRSKYDVLAAASERFYGMLHELDVAGIALSQVSNEYARNPSEQMSTKGANEWAEAADIVIDLAKVKGGNEKDINFDFKKNRAFHTRGVKQMAYNENWTRFERRRGL